MSKVVHVLFVLTAVGMLAACTTTSTRNTSASVSSAAKPELRTEVIKALTANVDAADVAIKASGVFTDTGTLKLPIGDPRTITMKFTRGDLVVLNATGPNGPLHINNKTCSFSQSLGGTYRVLSGNSTGSYAGTTGHGSYTFSYTRIAPRASSGRCDTGSRAGPTKALFTVLLRGPLVLNEGS